ncbi:MAG: ABC transporter transmembrane domain-containing protein, partial [Actinomycetota bacterium]
MDKPIGSKDEPREDLDPVARSEEPAPREPADKSPKNNDKSTGEVRRAFRLLRRYSAGQRRTFWSALLVLIFEAVTSVFEAYPLAYLIDYLRGDRPALDVPFLPPGDISTIAVLTVGILLLAMLNSAADSTGEILLARGGQTLGYQLRVALYGHLQRLSLSYHDRSRTGDVITRVTGDVKELEEFVTDSVSDLVGSMFLLVGTVSFIVFNSWQVALVAVLMIPILALVSNYFAQRIKKAAKKQRAREGDLASTTQEMLTSIRVVQTFGRTGHGEKRFGVESSQAMDAAYETSRLEAWFSWVWSTLKALAIGGVVWIGLFVVPREALPLGILVMLVILVEEMFKPTRKIIKEWNKIGKLFASVERVGDVLDREPTVKDEPGAVVAPRLRGDIEFRNVSFAYKLDPEDADNVAATGPELRQALKDMSFTVSQGEVVALVGHSGAGKSTIAQLVPRLYDPQEGRILLDGHDVRSFTIESLRDQISVVLQETVLFRGTVADNIAYGRDRATREEIVAAAQQANAHEFIEQMPDGYDTELSERASNLSGGQRQRLAIARALIRGTSLLILDEPTTGLDAESTEVVLAALKTLMHGKTTLLISHDLGLIRSADRILVLRAGEIEQQGSHDSLLRQGGLYAHLHAKQFSAGETPSAASASAAPASARSASESSASADSAEPDLSPALQSLKRTTEWYRRTFRELLAESLEPGADLRDRAAKGVDGPGGGADGRADQEIVDPLNSVELARELPGLEVALDGDAMRDHIQAALIGAGPGRPVIVRCTPGKVSYLWGEGCLIRYRLELTDAEGRTQRALVGGRLFKDNRAAEAFVQARLEPLAKRVRKREETAPFEALIAALGALPMAVYAFPIDPELPTLVSATDGRHMLRVFKSMAHLTSGEQLSIEDCRVELAHYPRRDRCLLRYELQGRGWTSEVSRVVYGKVASDGRSSATGAVLSALHEQILGNGGAGRFIVPRFIGLRPELNLALVEAIPGTPRIGRLIKERAAGGEGLDPGVTLDEAIDACGLIASTLHGTELDIEAVRTLEGDLEDLGPELGSLRQASPELAGDLDDWIAEIRAVGAATEPLAARPCHGDYTHSQVVFDDFVGRGLLDFDTMCLAEPALDLGQFC